MVTVAGYPGSVSLLVRSLCTPEQLLLSDRSSQELPPIEASTSEEVAAAVDAVQRTNASELIIEAAPRVSCCLLDASMALSEKRIDDLCAQLLQASAILDGVLEAVIPKPVCAESVELSTTETQADVPLVLDSVEIAATVECSKAMAAAA